MTDPTTHAAPADMTAADILAAIEIGALSPDTAVVPVAAIADRIAAAERIARTAGEDAAMTKAARAAADALGTNALPAGMTAVPATAHDCGMADCRHGETHGPDYVPQPDRQLKLVCPCGTVVRMTARALQRAGSLTCGSGHVLTIDDTRRAYRGAK